jgi:hypothetical protein
MTLLCLQARCVGQNTPSNTFLHDTPVRNPYHHEPVPIDVS